MATTDIIVPVWNRPVETRNCLVNLIQHSPDSRLILVDNGSDRETERMLEEFADALDHRAILLRNNVNQGYVRAVNRGLARSDAGYLAVVRNTSIVSPAWLEPLITLAETRRDAGILVPRLERGSATGKAPVKKPRTGYLEGDHGSLTAMIMARKTFDAIGGIDEEMDGGIWCLRDLSRRAYRAGFSTLVVHESTVAFEDDIPLGSLDRRRIALEKSVELYRQRWGESRSYCVSMPKGADIHALRQRIDVLLTGARQGNFFSVLVHGRLYKELSKAGVESIHENIRFIKLPLFLEARVMESSLRAGPPGMETMQAVAGVDGVPFSSSTSGIPFAELEAMISSCSKEFYGV